MGAFNCFQFTCRDAGAVMGAMMVGVVFTRFRWFLSYGCALTLCAITTVMVPLAETFIQTAAAVLAQGVLLGFLDCGKNRGHKVLAFVRGVELYFSVHVASSTSVIDFDSFVGQCQLMSDYDRIIGPTYTTTDAPL